MRFTARARPPALDGANSAAMSPESITLAAPMDALRKWAETHMEEVTANQQQCDAGEASGP
jgi:hypothetical protein